MRFQILCFVLACLSISPLSAAESMRYTTLGAKKGQLTPPELSIKSLNFEEEQKKRESLEAGNKERTESMDKVWKHYKALAEGRQEKDAAKPKAAQPVKPKIISAKRPSALPQIEPSAPATPAKPRLNAPEAEPASAAGEQPPRSLGILDQYEQSKARRSQMKMIRLGVPEELKKKEELPPASTAETEAKASEE